MRLTTDERVISAHKLTHLQNRPDLAEYTASTSWLRVFLVCFLALSPAFMFTIVVEFLPLRPPSEGWRANWVFWIRVFFSDLFLLTGIVNQIAMMIPACALSLKRVFFIAVGASTGFVAQIMLLACFWRFPVPFALLLGSPAMHIAMAICTISCVGLKRWQTNPDIMKQTKLLMPIAGVQFVLIIVYPAYSAIFMRLHGPSQVAFILVLPSIKYAMHTIVDRVTTGIAAAYGVRMVVVELFDALYMFKCIQSAGSLASGAGLIVVDLIVNVYHLRHVHKHVQCVKQLVKNSSKGDHKDRIHESIARISSRSPSVQRLSNRAIVPSSAVGPSVKRMMAINANMRPASSIKLDDNIGELLEHCERLVLTEFVECSVPIFYVIYMLVLYHLPNARFYPEMQRFDATTLDKTVRNIVAYAMLEFASLLYVHAYLRWELNISALHLLANVLEREIAGFQSVFMIWIILVLQFTLQHTGTHVVLFDLLCVAANNVWTSHLGTDLSFSFNWS